MRTTIRHTPPADTQPEPVDNTAEHVYAQAAAWAEGYWWSVAGWQAPGQLINVQSAMEIAAWYQTPRNGFAAFASTGTLTEGLAGDITGEIQCTRDQPDNFDNPYRDRRCLRALLAYVRAVTVPVWTVGSNTVGYLPESDVLWFMDYADASEAYVDMVREAPDTLTDTSDVGDCSADATCGSPGMLSDEWCAYHELSADVGAFLTDDGPNVARPRDLALALRPGWHPLPTVYFLTLTRVTYGEYVDQD